MKGKEKKGVMLAVVAIALVVLASVTSAQPIPVTLSDLIQINAEPASVPADGESTSRITIAVFWPELEELGDLCGTPAAHTPVLVETTRGVLTDTEDMNSTGKDIEVFTGDNGVASVLLSGSEKGTANITARATGIESTVNDVLANKTTVYVVQNSTSVEFIAPGTTTAPSGDGGNGDEIPPTPPPGTLPYVDLSANPADIPADGSSTSTITALVWDGEDWMLENLTVKFSTDLGDITASALVENGTATAILTAWTEPGAATITAEANLSGDVGTITNTNRVNFTTPGVTPTPPVLTPTPTPTVTVSLTPTATVSPAPSPTKKPLIPGFEAVFAIASLLAVAYLVLRGGRGAQS